MEKVEDKIKKIENENPYYNILNVLNDCFGKKDNENLRKYHKTISISTGIYVGLSYHYDIRCPINLLRKSFEKIKKAETKPKKPSKEEADKAKKEKEEKIKEEKAKKEKEKKEKLEKAKQEI